MSKKTQENKKVKNATSLEYDGILFKSKFEKSTYIALKEAGFPVEYEPQKISMWKGFKPTVPFYDKNNVTRMLKLQMKKMVDITYTPDFMFEHNNHTIIIEAKGFTNDVFPIKKKLFRAWLEKHPESVYFEVYSKKQVLQAIEIINNLN
jgi:hypothetical protein